MIQTLKNVKEYKEELIRPAIREMLEALDIARDLRPGMKVVIKPNLVMAKKPDFILCGKNGHAGQAYHAHNQCKAQ